MNFNKKLFFVCVSALFMACNTDNDEKFVGSGVLGLPNYEVNKKEFLLNVENLEINSVQTNSFLGDDNRIKRKLLLGQISQGNFGTTNVSVVSQLDFSTNTAPAFGLKIQSSEDSSISENEKVEKVTLYIPFLSKSRRVVNDENQIVSDYKLDSIFGDKKAQFDLQVQELTYFLSNTDENYEAKKYFSDFDFNGKIGQVIGNQRVTISKEPIVEFNEDLKDTEINEAEQEKRRLTPGIYAELDKQFFQQRFLDKEGSKELENKENFINYLRGIVISTSNFSQNALALMDFSEAKIFIDYSFEQKTNQKETLTRYKTYELKLSGTIFNKIEVKNRSISLSPQKIFLQGGQGYIAQVNIPSEELQDLKNNKVLVNQADIIFYVSQNTKNLPQFLSVYNAKTGSQLPDFGTDVFGGLVNTFLGIGVLEKDEKEQYYYRFSITDYFINALNSDKNIELGFTTLLNNSQESMFPIDYKIGGETKKMVLGSIQNVHSVELFGKENKEKQPKLRVYYSIPN